MWDLSEFELMWVSYLIQVAFQEFHFFTEPSEVLEGITTLGGKAGYCVGFLTQLQESWVSLQLVPHITQSGVHVADVFVDVAHDGSTLWEP